MSEFKVPAARPQWRRRAKRRGLSLVEVLVSLAVTASLLTAAAAAFDASASAVEMNDRFSRATQAGRVSLNHLLTHVRRGTVDKVWAEHEVSVATADTPERDGQGFTYRYLPATKQLMLVTDDDPNDRDYVLASDVSDAEFFVEMGDDYNGAPCVARVTVSLTVTVGDNTVRLSGAAAPRKNLIY